MNNKEYYVYEYIDPRNGEIFYIGQGKGKRYLIHKEMVIKEKIKNYSLIKNQRYKRIKEILDLGLEPIINKIHNNLTKQEAYDIEHSYIISLGRKDLGTGCLLNLTNGYEFCKDKVYCQPSPKAISLSKIKFYESEEGKLNKQYLSDLYKGKPLGSPEEWLGEERGKQLREIRKLNVTSWWSQFTKEERSEMFTGENNPFFGKSHTPETRDKIRKARKGTKLDENTKNKISETLKRNPNLKGANNYQAKEIMLFCPDGSIEYIKGNLCAIAKKYKIANKTIKELANGKRKEHKGYTAKWGWDKES